MPFTFSILDETTAGERFDAGAFVCESATTTLRDLIRIRVQQEVDRYNHSDAKTFRGLIQPEATERILNGERPLERLLDWEKQYAHATAAFQTNGFLVMVDDRQIMELDEPVILEPQSKVTFLKLVPLIGG
jgi:hypothetical protein